MACIFGTIGGAYAEQTPQVLGNDSRIQYFNYDPNTVYVINTKIAYSSLIQLEDGEEITANGGMGMGDSKSWNVAVKGKNIFFKPLTENPDTNIVLVTNKRTYAFVLKTVSPEDESKQTYIARFIYPIEKVEEPKEQAPSQPKSLKIAYTDSKGTQNLIDSSINTNYEYRGEPMLKPINVWDDGLFTYLRFGGNDLPTIYRVLPDKSEALVNTHVENDTIILQEIGKNYRLRFGKAVGEIRNKGANVTKFNTTGTADNDYVRTIQGQ